MSRPQVTEQRCKVALNRVQGMPLRWSLNPYRGCEHACAYCLVPETPVLYADLTWRPIGEVQVGDQLVGFDEHPGAQKYRYFRTATVEAVWWSRKPVRRVVTDQGEVIATDEHRWLRHGRAWWVSTRMLGVGRALRHLPVAQPEQIENDDYRAGYITGITVGDGTFCYEPGQRSDKLGYPQAYWRVAMADFEPLARLVDYLAAFGVAAAVRPFDGGPGAVRELRKVEVRALEPLRIIHGIVSAERATRDYGRGFLAGFFDAEGSNDGENLRLTQKDRRVLERVVSYAARLGMVFEIEQHGSHLPTARLVGTLFDRLRFFSICRPAIARKMAATSGHALRLNPSAIEAIERRPGTDVVDIQTSTHTFFAAGLATHNCYARTTHAFLGLDVGEDFASRLFAKVNVAGVLRQELGRRGWQREAVAVGTATDPYQGVEGRYRLTRACLEALADFRTPAHVTTKGTLVVRDVDVLQSLGARAGGAGQGQTVTASQGQAGADGKGQAGGAGVSVSLITLDERVWRTLEPGTPPPRQRLAALRRLADAGVPCGIALAPVLPGITDAPDALDALARAAADHGAQWLWAGAVHLEPAVRDWLLGQLARHFPSVAPAYGRVYGQMGQLGGQRYAPKWYAERLSHQIAELKDRYGLSRHHREARALGSTLPEAPASPGPPQQLALPL